MGKHFVNLIVVDDSKSLEEIISEHDFHNVINMVVDDVVNKIIVEEND